MPSTYATAAKGVGVDIITWTLERTGPPPTNAAGYYYQSVTPVLDNDGDLFLVLDALARKVRVKGIFAD